VVVELSASCSACCSACCSECSFAKKTCGCGAPSQKKRVISRSLLTAATPYVACIYPTLQHSATGCNKLQHTAQYVACAPAPIALPDSIPPAAPSLLLFRSHFCLSAALLLSSTMLCKCWLGLSVIMWVAVIEVAQAWSRVAFKRAAEVDSSK